MSISSLCSILHIPSSSARIIILAAFVYAKEQAFGWTVSAHHSTSLPFSIDDQITPYYVRSRIFKLVGLISIKTFTIIFGIRRNGNFEKLLQPSSRDTYSCSSLMRIPHHRNFKLIKSYTIFIVFILFWNAFIIVWIMLLFLAG